MEESQKKKKNFFRRHKILTAIMLLPLLIIIGIACLYGAFRYDAYTTKTYLNKVGDGYIRITPDKDFDYMLKDFFADCEYQSYGGDTTCSASSNHVRLSNGEEYYQTDECLLPRKTYENGRLVTSYTNNCNDAAYQYDGFASLIYNIFN